MIELKQMSNRRQNVGSYLPKELCLIGVLSCSDLESLLLDYDVHSNHGTGCMFWG
jgi:hypothetical protein